MNEYHKIQTMFKRDMTHPKKLLMEGQWTLPEFEYLANNTWTWTEKVDGTNIRIKYDGEKVEFGGKTDNAQLPGRLVKRLQERFPDATAFKREFGLTPVCLYGEGYGAGIQKGGTYGPEQDFVLFDIKIEGWWLQRKDLESLAKTFGLDIVPIVGQGTLYEAISHVKQGMQSTWGDFISEGIVARPAIELKARNGERIITKIKHCDFVQV